MTSQRAGFDGDSRISVAVYPRGKSDISLIMYLLLVLFKTSTKGTEYIMSFVKLVAEKSPRKSVKSSASLLGLTAGALSWSSLAQAASEETNFQMILLPEHYEAMENGLVVLKLENGQSLSLTEGQYLILEDGLLLITDELAQASIYSLPVIGAARAQLVSDLEPVASTSSTLGTSAEIASAQALSMTEGQAPRLSEEVSPQRYEVAQTMDTITDTAEALIPLSLSSATGFMVLAEVMQTGAAPYWFNTANWEGSQTVFPNVPVGRDLPETLIGVPGTVVGLNHPSGYSAVYYGETRQDALASTENLLINPEDESLGALYVYMQNISVIDGGLENPTEVDGSFFQLYPGPAFWEPGITGYDPGTFSTIFGIDFTELARAGWTGSNEIVGDIWNFEVVVEDQSGNVDIWDLTLDYSDSEIT